MLAFDPTVQVTFADGTVTRLLLNTYDGACLVGDPTVYVYRDSGLVWVKPEGDYFVECGPHGETVMNESLDARLSRATRALGGIALILKGIDEADMTTAEKKIWELLKKDGIVKE